jgi:hypothetical protein
MSGRKIRPVSNPVILTLCAAVLLAAASRAGAVPSFARQTGMACEACHTVYPELTHFGRMFKANGYILSNTKQVRDVTGKKEELLSLAQTVPLSIMAQISYTQMKTTVPDLSNAWGRTERHRRFPAAAKSLLRRQDRAQFRRLLPAHLLERRRHHRHRQYRSALCGHDGACE